MKIYFEYLDQLRASGDLTDRFAAPIYLERKFGLSENDAISVFSLWAKTFDASKPVELRVVEADSDD